MCFLIACWEQLASKAQVSRFIPSHSLTDTLDTVDSYPMFLTDTLHILTLFNNRPNCYTLYAVALYPIFCNRPNCYTSCTVDSYPMFSTQPPFKTMCSDKQSLEGVMLVNSLMHFTFFAFGKISLSRCKLVPQSSRHARQIKNTLFFMPCKTYFSNRLDHSLEKI